jgi:hypothetical protein
MRIVLALAAVAALSACAEPAPEPAAEETAAAEPMAETGVAAGTYDVTDADGAMGKTTINADGTYVDTDAEGTETRGAYVRRDGKDCFDPEGDEAEMCWTVTEPAADGSFTATAPDGTAVTVKPQAAAAAPAAAPAAPVAE